MQEKWLLLPVFTALTGWLVVKFLLYLLFRPFTPVKLLGFSLQGIVPANRQNMTMALGRLAAKEINGLLSSGQISSSPGSLEKLMPLIELHIDDFLRVKLVKQMPVIGMFIGDKTIADLKGVFLSELKELFPVIMENYIGHLGGTLDIEKMVTQKLESLSTEEMEKFFYNHFSNKLRLIEWMGISLGFLVGLLELLIIYFL